MPELSPKQLAVWLLIASVVLFVGARALRSDRSSPVNPGSLAAASAGELGEVADLGLEADRVGLQLEDAPAPGAAAATEGFPVFVHVAGAVRRPGLYRLPAPTRIGDALRRAGGPTAAADLDQINLAATVSDGQQVLVPKRGEAPTAAGPESTAANANGVADGTEPIRLASATAAELETIDGIGPVTAAKILDFRDREAPIDSVEELDAIPGIGPATMQTLRQALVP